MGIKSILSKPRGWLQNGYSRSVSARRHPEDEDATVKVYINVELLRVVTYVNFFIMVICTLFFQRFLVKPRLEKGPDVPGDICGPFNGDLGERLDPPVLPGEGFDVSTQSHLNRAFGYNNVCANWDYTPSREITAMIYPIFEYALLLYCFFDFIQVYVYYKKGWVSKYYYRTFQVLITFMIIFTSWFRMIFVVIAYQDLSGHTAGFFGFQLTMIMTAVLNILFIIDTKAEFKLLGGRKGTLIASYTYLAMQLAISPLKLILTANIVFAGEAAGWSLNKVGSMYAGEFIDNIWFICNAVLPLFIAIIRAFSEPPLKISVDCPIVRWSGEEPMVKGPWNADENDAVDMEADPLNKERVSADTSTAERVPTDEAHA